MSIVSAHLKWLCLAPYCSASHSLHEDFYMQDSTTKVANGHLLIQSFGHASCNRRTWARFRPEEACLHCCYNAVDDRVGWNDSLPRFVTGMTADKPELDKIYFGIGIIETCARITATAGWSMVYAKAVDQGWFIKRTMFLASSCILLVSLVSVIALGRFTKLSGPPLVQVWESMMLKYWAVGGGIFLCKTTLTDMVRVAHLVDWIRIYDRVTNMCNPRR